MHLPRGHITAEGEINSRFDRVKRDSRGKNVLRTMQLVRERSFHRRCDADCRGEGTGGSTNRARSTGASNPDDIASRYITRNFMAYYRTAYGI